MNPEKLLAHSDFLRSLSHSLVFDKNRAADIYQDAFVAALKHPPSDQTNLPAWLTQVAKNCMRMLARGEQRRRVREEAAASAEAIPSPEQIVQEEELRSKVVKAVLRLKEPLQAPIVLRYYRNLSMKETAKRLGITQPTLRKRLAQGLEELRSRLDHAYNGRRQWLHSIAMISYSIKKTKALSFFTLPFFLKAGAALVMIIGLLLLSFYLMVFWQPKESCVFIPIAEADAPPLEEDTPNTQTEKERIDPTPKQAPKARQGRVRGRVLDPHGAPISGVKIQATALSGATYKSNDKEDPLKALISGKEGWSQTFFSTKGKGHILAENQTRALGEFEILIPLDAPMALELVFTKSGRQTHCLEVVAHEGKTRTLKDVVLKPGGQVSGKVVDQFGRPVKDATLKFYNSAPLWPFCGEFYAKSGPEMVHNLVTPFLEDLLDLNAPKLIKESRTDAQGNFLIQDLPIGYGRLWATTWDTQHAHTGLIEIKEGVASTGILVALTPEPGAWKIKGQVLDPKGAPFPSARLRYQFKFGESRMSVSDDPDEQGCFVYKGSDTKLRDPLKRSQAEMTILAEDPKGVFGSVLMEKVPLDADNIKIRMAPEKQTFFLKIKSQTEQPIKKVRLELEVDRYCDLFDTTLTLELSSNRIEAPAPLIPFSIKVSSKGHFPQTLGPFDPDRIPSPLEVALKPSPGIQGVVWAEGKPCPGARIALHPTPGSDKRVFVNGVPSFYGRESKGEAVSDPQGAFTLNLFRSRLFYLRAEKSGYAPADLGPVWADHLKGLSGLKIELKKAGAIQGKVVVDRNPGDLIVLASRGDAYPTTTRVDPQGNFSFKGLTPGRWQVMLWDQDISKNGYSQSFESGSTRSIEFQWSCFVAAGETTHYNIMVPSDKPVKPCVFQGRFLMNSEAPIGWTASLKKADASHLSKSLVKCPVDQEGNFHLKLKNQGLYSLVLTGPGAAGNLLWLRDEVVLHSGKNPVWELDLPMGSVQIKPEISTGKHWYKWFGEKNLSAYSVLSHGKETYSTPIGSGALIEMDGILLFPHMRETLLKKFQVLQNQPLLIHDF